MLIACISQSLVNLAIHGPGTSERGDVEAVIKARAVTKMGQEASRTRHRLAKDKSRSAFIFEVVYVGRFSNDPGIGMAG